MYAYKKEKGTTLDPGGNNLTLQRASKVIILQVLLPAAQCSQRLFIFLCSFSLNESAVIEPTESS